MNNIGLEMSVGQPARNGCKGGGEDDGEHDFSLGEGRAWTILMPSGVGVRGTDPRRSGGAIRMERLCFTEDCLRYRT